MEVSLVLRQYRQEISNKITWEIKFACIFVDSCRTERGISTKKTLKESKQLQYRLSLPQFIYDF